MSPQRDMARFMVPGPDEDPSYRAKAQEFIRYAQNGEVDKMLAITSTLTVPTQTDSMRSLYSKQVIPEFAGTVVTWNARSKPNIDDRNNAGLMFTGTARGKKIFVFDIAVMKENEQLLVINIKKKY